MTNAELAEWLNTEMDLADDFRVTNNIVRQWVGWNLLPKTSILGRESDKGPIWYRDTNALKAAQRLAEFRQCGLRAKNQLLARCFIDGWNIDIADARLATFNWARFRLKTMNKRLTLDYSRIDADAELSAVQTRALRNQLGTQDDRFKRTPFEFTGDMGVSLNLVALTGEKPPPKILAEITKSLPISGELQKLWLELLPTLAAGISGMAGSPDEIENSLLDSIDNCTDQVFVNSRNMVKCLFEGVKDAEISNMAQLEIGIWTGFVFNQLKQLDCTEWPIMILAIICHAQHNSKSELPKLPSYFIGN
jgi:hypothetical protein